MMIARGVGRRPLHARAAILCVWCCACYVWRMQQAYVSRMQQAYVSRMLLWTGVYGVCSNSRWSRHTRVYGICRNSREGFDRPTDRQTDAQKHRQTCVVHSAGTCHHYGHVSRPTSGFRLQHSTLTMSELACRAPTQVERHRQLPRNAGQGHGESRRGAAKGPGQCGRVSSRAQRPELLKLKHTMGTCQSSVGPDSMGPSDLHALWAC